ncbi:T9SS type A sorting domain-containing protein, partial [Candidatus Poribacteria bacterium]|nr:T9SS type A sorting domain-containing protein [Candidatus Poribacteria bacterium]
LTFTVGAGAIAGYNGPALTAQVSVSAGDTPADTENQNPETPQQTGNQDTSQQLGDTGGTPTLSVSTAVPLTEATLHGSIITLNLSSGTYEGSSWRIRGAVSVSGIPGITLDLFTSRDRVSDTEITIELEYDGNMTANGTLTISVGAGAIQDYNGAALTSQISVPAVSESVTASTASPLTEATLDESVVTLTLSGRKFERWNTTIRSAVSVSGISGVTVRSFDIDRQSDTEVTVELTFNGDMTANGTLTFTVGAGAIAGYNGAALTAQVTVTADRENALLANFPNPFNPETWIPYQLSKPTDVTISIYNINGQLVRTLALGHQAAGVYQSRSRAAYWDGKNQYGEPVASGVYFYTLTAGNFTATRKMLIRK